MKTILFLLLLIVSAGSAYSQFNKSYLLSDRRIIPQSVLKTTFGEVYATGATYPDPILAGTYGYKSSIIHLDDDGNVLNMIQIANSYAQQSSKIIETKDEQLLYAAYSVQDAAVIIIKFDKDLHPVWSTEVPVNPYFYSNVDIIRQSIGADDASGAESGQEYYYVGYSDKAADPAYPWDYSYCLAKLDENGSFIWNNMYTMANRPALTILQDNFSSICSYTDNRERKFRIAIAGTRHEETATYATNTLGVLTVNEDGSVFDQYHKMNTSSYYEYKNAHINYDVDNASFIVSTMEVSGTPYIASDLNLIRISNDFSSISSAIYSSDCENYNMAVFKAHNSNEYLLGCTQTECTIYQGNYISTFGLYRIDASTLGVNDFLRYNIYAQRPTSLISNENAFTIDNNDNCYMTSSKVFSNWQFDQQIMKTDNTGEACGAVHLTPYTRSFTTELFGPLEYKQQDHTTADYNPDIEDETVSVFQCEDYPSGQFKATAPLNIIESPEIFPTYLLLGDEVITVRLTKEFLSDSKLSIYDMQGKKVIQKRLNNNETTVQINIGKLPAGIYLVTLQNMAGKRFDQKIIIK